LSHYAAPSFWRCYEALPEPVRTLADKQFQLLKTDPRHPSLPLADECGGHPWGAIVSDEYKINHRITSCRDSA